MRFIQFTDCEDFAEEMFDTIEKEYGCKIARVPYFAKTNIPYSFDLKIIFTDFTLLEAIVSVEYEERSPYIHIQGNYY